MASKEFQIKAPGCGCCCGPCRDQAPFGHADRIRWYQYAIPLLCRNQIDNYLVKGVGSEFFARNYSCRRACNTHLWNPDVCQYQLRPDGNPTLSTYHPYHKVNVGPRMYEQKWTFDDFQKSWVPLKADGTAWPQGLQVGPDDFTNPVYPLRYGQYPGLGYRLGSPGIQLTYEASFEPRPVPAALSSPVALTDGSTANDALIVAGGWGSVPGDFTATTYNMAAEGVVETSDGYYGPAAVWDRTCVRAPKMYSVRQKLIQHIVSADGLYDFEEILYPVVEYPWSPLHNNSRAFSFSRYPGKSLYDASDVQLEGVTYGGQVGETSSYEVADTYWNGYFFTGAAGGGFPSRYPAFPVALGKLGTPYRWNPDRGPTSPFAYRLDGLGSGPDLGSHRIATSELGIQFSLDQRWRRWVGDTYGAWSASSVELPVPPFPEPPVFIRGGYSFPNYVGLGYLHPEYPTPTLQFRTLLPDQIWRRDVVDGLSVPFDMPNILTTLGRNRWTTINPVVYFFRDYLWLDGKYRLCDITITEGNEDYVWTPPAGYTNLGLMAATSPGYTRESWPREASSFISLVGLVCDDRFSTVRPATLNNISHIRYPVFQLVGTGVEGTYTFGGQEAALTYDPTINSSTGLPNGYGAPFIWSGGTSSSSECFGRRGDALLPGYANGSDRSLGGVDDDWVVRVPNGNYEVICTQMPAFKILGGAWQELKATGMWPRNFSAWGADMKYLFQFTDFYTGGFDFANLLGTDGIPDINSGTYFQELHPNGNHRIEQPDYVPFTGIRGGVRNGLNVKMVGATVEIYGGTTFTPPASMTLLATTTTDMDGAWEVNVTPDSFYVVVNGNLYEQASGSPGDPTYYGAVRTPPFFSYPVDPPVYEFNLEIHSYTPRA